MHFYRDILRLQLLPGHDDPPHFMIKGVISAILQGEPQPPLNPAPERFPVLAFAVDDLEPMVGVLEVNNVDMPWGVEGTPEAPWNMLRDPAGNLIEIAQLPAFH